MNSHSKTVAKNAAVVGGATLASRILGFLRDLIIAFALGAGPMADAFFVAFRLPNLLRRLFGEGSLTMAFVPVFTRTREDSGEAEAHTFARSALVWLVLILGVITACAGLLAKPLVLVVAPGFADDPQLVAVTAELVRICFPYIIFISGVALCMGILNSSGHFLAPALAPCILNTVLIASALAGVAMGWSVPHCLAWGVVLAGLGQWLLQQPYLARLGFSWRGPWSFSNPGVKKTGKLMLPTVFGAAVYQINIILGTVLASFLAVGSISYLYYADRLVQFPLGVFGVAVSTAALPSLSLLAAKGQMDDFRQTLSASLRLTLFISLPAAAGLIGLSEPIVSLLFGRGAFSAEAVSMTAWALVGYGVGLPAFAMVRPLVSACYALQDTRTPVRAAVVSLLVYVISGVTLMQVMDHVGLALATTISSWVNAGLLLRGLNRHLGRWADFWRQVALFVALSLVMGAAAWLTIGLGRWAVALVPLWGVGYGVATWLLKVPEARMVVDVLRRRLGR
ncbi:murein biosynthesis integral membrane protein MurJ [Desulfovibrio ferrophilus]|uniref:Probable lipid II flippase MurJ n=1 Tax=Desulfovibrio ferrophilus TaxID=241368 RepID=A0A2Z6B045_9BACT|nr:murein biosynthesis integral membrane protein MurJ [Desulfovibrio ferrophilus]BBD08815.1 integral membrane protein MviN [Desulfovibrio ferrophilus]